MTKWQHEQWVEADKPDDPGSLSRFAYLTKYGDASACGGKQEG